MQNPNLVPLVFPTVWAGVYSVFLHHVSKLAISPKSWTFRDLKTAFKTLIMQTHIPLKFFLMIDGLDEFAGDHEDLVQLFHQVIQPKLCRVKVCLSSRPWVVFEDSFRTCASLKLQNLTYKDIEIYVDEKLRSNLAFQRLSAQEPEATPKLVAEIVEKADGVFLWVRIVVKSLLSGLRNLDDMSDLWKRLRLLPKELEPLYDHLMGLMEPVYMEWVSKVFRILQASRGLNTMPPQKEDDTSSSSKEGNPLTLIVVLLAINENLSLMDIRKMTPEYIASTVQ